LVSQTARFVRWHLAQLCVRRRVLPLNLNGGHYHVTSVRLQPACGGHRINQEISAARGTRPASGQSNHPNKRLSGGQRGKLGDLLAELPKTEAGLLCECGLRAAKRREQRHFTS